MTFPWPRTCAAAPVTAVFKRTAEDFRVRETLVFKPSGRGEHLYLRLEKTDIATPFLADEIARGFGVAPVAVGYAGMKDRHSVAEQWFSVSTAKDAAAFPGIEGVRLLNATRHSRKLRKGQLADNRFDICLRDLGKGDWERRLQSLVAHGAPNYFGPQRFGGNNLDAALAWLPKRRRVRVSRFKQSLYLSVLRSYLFNEVLGTRVEAGSWNRPVFGEVLEEGAEVATPTGPLWGRGRSAAVGTAAEIESGALFAHRGLLALLEHTGLTQGRRSLVLHATELAWQPHEGGLKISFRLPPGGYATALLREAFVLMQPKVQHEVQHEIQQ